MRSNLVFGAIAHISNRFLLAKAVAKATRKLHRPHTRIPDTMNDVLVRFALVIPITLRVLFLAVYCFAAGLVANGDGNKMGRLEGTVSSGDAATRSYVVGAKIQARGPVTVETKTDGERTVYVRRDACRLLHADSHRPGARD